jgi:flagellar basal body P-ring formation protein FlgA
VPPLRGLLVGVMLLAAAPAWSAAPGVTIRFAADARVQKEEMLLGDLATIDGDEALAAWLRALKLGAAPAPGASVGYEAAELRRRLGQARVVEGERIHLLMPERVQVTRAFQDVPASALVEAAAREVQRQLAAQSAAREGGTDAAAEAEPYALVPVGRPGDLRLPAGSLDLATRVQDLVPQSAFAAVVVTVRLDGRDYQSVAVSFRIGRYRPVLVAARTLDTTRVLGAADFRVEKRASTEVPDDALSELGDAGDLEALRPVKAGEVITPYLLRPRMLVRRGETVTLLVEERGFRITTQGQASEDARRGDPVRVVNLASKREVLGTVQGPGVVRVAIGASLRGDAGARP